MFEKLTKAGYQKSDYVKGLITNGLKDAGEKLEGEPLKKLIKAIEKKDQTEVESLLLPIKGIGHFVIKNFIALCES